MLFLKRKPTNPKEAADVVTSLEFECEAMESDEEALQAEHADLALSVEQGEADASKRLVEVTGALEELSKKKAHKTAALNAARRQYGSEVEAAHKRNIASMWAETEAALSGIDRLAVELESMVVRACQIYREIQEKRSKAFDVAPRKDGTPFNDSLLGEMRLETSFRFLLRKNGLPWASGQFTDSYGQSGDHLIPPFASAMAEGGKWVLKLREADLGPRETLTEIDRS